MRHAVGNQKQVGILVDQCSQTARDDVLKARNCNGDWWPVVHFFSAPPRPPVNYRTLGKKG